MKLMVESDKKVIEVSLQPDDRNMLWDLMDKLEDRAYYLGETWKLKRRARPDKLTFIVEQNEDKRVIDIEDERRKKKAVFEIKQVEAQKRDEQRALDEFARTNQSRRGMSVESENIDRHELEKRQKKS